MESTLNAVAMEKLSERTGMSLDILAELEAKVRLACHDMSIDDGFTSTWQTWRHGLREVFEAFDLNGVLLLVDTTAEIQWTQHEYHESRTGQAGSECQRGGTKAIRYRDTCRNRVERKEEHLIEILGNYTTAKALAKACGLTLQIRAVHEAEECDPGRIGRIKGIGARIDERSPKHLRERVGI